MLDPRPHREALKPQKTSPRSGCQVGSRKSCGHLHLLGGEKSVSNVPSNYYQILGDRKGTTLGYRTVFMKPESVTSIR